MAVGWPPWSRRSWANALMVVCSRPRGAVQQPLGIQIVHHGDVVVSAAQAGLVDADDAHLAHVLLLAGLAHVVLDAAPQLLVAHAQRSGGLANGQFPAHRQRQRFEQQREAAALTRPRHVHLRRLAAGRASHTRHIGVQPSLVLEEVQMPPRALKPVMHLLCSRTAGRTRQQRLLALDIEVDAVLGRVKPHIPHRPRCLQTQRAGEQRFDSNVHVPAPDSRPVDMWTGSKAACPHAHRARRRQAILTVGFHTKRRGAQKAGFWARKTGFPARDRSRGKGAKPGHYRGNGQKNPD